MGSYISTSTSKPKKSAPGGTITAADRAVLDLKNSRDRLGRFRKKLEMDQEKLLERAKKSQKEGNKSMAMHLMKLRKHKISEVTNVENQLLTIYEMVDKIAGKENELEIMKAMDEGKNALEYLHREMSVDDVLHLMDEIEEQSEVEHQINEILRQGAGLSSIDESAIEDELAAMEMELQKEKGGEIQEPNLPVVATGALPDILPVAPSTIPSVQEDLVSPMKQLVAS